MLQRPLVSEPFGPISILANLPSPHTSPPITPPSIHHSISSPSLPTTLHSSILLKLCPCPMPSSSLPPLRCRCRLRNAWGNAGRPHTIGWRDHRERRQEIQAVLWHELGHCHAEVLWRCCRVPVRTPYRLLHQPTHSEVGSTDLYGHGRFHTGGVVERLPLERKPNPNSKKSFELPRIIPRSSLLIDLVNRQPFYLLHNH